MVYISICICIGGAGIMGKSGRVHRSFAFGILLGRYFFFQDNLTDD